MGTIDMKTPGARSAKLYRMGYLSRRLLLPCSDDGKTRQSTQNQNTMLCKCDRTRTTPPLPSHNLSPRHRVSILAHIKLHVPHGKRDLVDRVVRLGAEADVAQHLVVRGPVDLELRREFWVELDDAGEEGLQVRADGGYRAGGDPREDVLLVVVLAGEEVAASGRDSVSIIEGIIGRTSETYKS